MRDARSASGGPRRDRASLAIVRSAPALDGLLYHVVTRSPFPCTFGYIFAAARERQSLSDKVRIAADTLEFFEEVFEGLVRLVSRGLLERCDFSDSENGRTFLAFRAPEVRR
jgi:hypothetical protein